MLQVNMLEAKTNLSKLVTELENRTNDVVILARGGKPVAKIIPIIPKRNFIGAGLGQFSLPSAQAMEQLDQDFLNEFEEDV